MRFLSVLCFVCPVLPNSTPPLVPELKSVLDTSHFRQLTETHSEDGERDMETKVSNIFVGIYWFAI